MQSSSARTRRVTGSQGTRAQSPPEFNALSPSRGQIHRLRNPHPYHRRVQCLGRAAADRAGKRQDFTRPAQSMRAHALSNTPGSPGGPNLPPLRACARTQPSAAAGPRCRRDSSACSTAARAAWSPSIAPMRGLYEALGLDIVRGIGVATGMYRSAGPVACSCSTHPPTTTSPVAPDRGRDAHLQLVKVRAAAAGLADVYDR